MTKIRRTNPEMTRNHKSNRGPVLTPAFWVNIYAGTIDLKPMVPTSTNILWQHLCWHHWFETNRASIARFKNVARQLPACVRTVLACSYLNVSQWICLLLGIVSTEQRRWLWRHLQYNRFARQPLLRYLWPRHDCSSHQRLGVQAAHEQGELCHRRVSMAVAAS